MKKVKIRTGKLRTPYYELSDAVWGFKSATVDTDDAKLKALVKKISNVQDEIHRHLEANYIWD